MSHKAARIGLTSLILVLAFAGLLYSTMGESLEYYKKVDEVMVNPAEWQGKAHPMAWTKSYGQGRVFYTTLGHTKNTFERPAMQQLITQGVRWAGAGN